MTFFSGVVTFLAALIPDTEPESLMMLLSLLPVTPVTLLLSSFSTIVQHAPPKIAIFLLA